jgi:multisubunit Na+/H+ antiporter MnhC subunit
MVVRGYFIVLAKNAHKYKYSVDILKRSTLILICKIGESEFKLKLMGGNY